ncbi:MBL fold metallo-hydrolase [Deinococcus maricopensis]|uniref:Beta-lactamase domain protein n=1 Tax=Deinococcus maricopensis (strain DSM 21211 / LMG 22137 / NRRL B-23946 / LB-34) TaxID=709986 RepID=E8U4W5_DEIML|nr:MBL fold metallo-hydrolase [Deinococcus maricopensis]ADV66104.1 beta-lactamase domain protein [Deinococcus maricopensis DSM 21211]
MLTTQVLGAPTEDNALLITADSGQQHTRLLLDCGADVLREVPLADILRIDHLLFSHLHMDHVCGFDAFFRANFGRVDRENHVWGPPGTIAAIHHRFQGYWWNHARDLHATWFVHDVDERLVRTARFEAHEAFRDASPAGERPHAGEVLVTPTIRVSALPLQHHGLSLGYVVREPERVTVNADALRSLGVPPGPWLARLKQGEAGPLELQGTLHDSAALRDRLLVREAGQSAAYLTDFLLDGATHERLRTALAGVGTLFVEAQYAPDDEALAVRHHHTTVTQVAALARDAGVTDVQLIHLSRRYRRAQWPELLAAARTLAPQARFPDGWLTAVKDGSGPEPVGPLPHDA